MLILCEKPTVAQSFADALKLNKKDGYYSDLNELTVITYCYGHLFELEDPDYYIPENTNKRNINYLPVIPDKFKYKKIYKNIKQINKINELLKKHKDDKIIIATDADREGEIIARIVINESHININYSNCYRFWTSECLTPEVISKTMDKMLPLSEYDKLAASGFSRQHADWICGMNLSRYISFGNSSIFSVGRVQTALLAAIAKRNKDIENFIPQKYYELKILLKDVKGNIAEAYLINEKNNKTSFEDKNMFPEIIENIKKSKLNINSKTVAKAINSPHLLSFTELAKIAADKYNYTTEQTLNIAQILYEKYKCLSYPRTNGTVMGEDNVEVFYNAYKIVKNQNSISKLCVEDFINKENKKLFNSKKIAKENHHALIPLDVISDKASQEEKNIYNIVLKVFLQSIMKNFLYDELQMIVSADKYKLKSKVKTITQIGWKESEPDEELRSFSKGFDPDTAIYLSSEIQEKYTQPKKQFTESSLLAFMENPTGEEDDEKLVGLGTEATRGSIIQKLFSTGYCEKKNKSFFVTKKGFYLLDLLLKDNELKQIANIAQTTKWEKQLKDDPENFEEQIKEYVKKCIKPKDNISMFEKENFGKCPLCSEGNIYRNKYSYFCSKYKDGCKFNVSYHICEATILPSDFKILLEGKTTKLMHMKNKNGKEFTAKLKLSYQENLPKIEFIFENKKNSKL